MANVVMSLTGDKALDKQLARIAAKEAKRIARQATRSGMAVVQKSLKAAAPDKATRKSIGSRQKRQKGLLASAKVGINIGKKRNKRVPTALWTTLGTVRRQTKSGANRGSIQAHDFIPGAFASSTAACQAKMAEVVKAGIAGIK